MAIPERLRRAASVLACLSASGCSVTNLSYAEVERDLDAVVRVEGGGDEQRLVFESDVLMAPWYLRASLLVPFRPLLTLFLADRTREQLENPSRHARELMLVLDDKAGSDPVRAAASVQRLVRFVELDPSALNRIVALDGLSTLAEAHELDLVEGLDRLPLRLQVPSEGQKWLADFTELRPAAREPVGSSLPDEQAARYREALAGLSQQPLVRWQDRLALCADLGNALIDEDDGELWTVTRAALERALRHAIQLAVLGALQGRDPDWIEVRMRALELLHRAGGPDSVPLLLALLVASPERVATGEPAFETHETMRRRLIHLCGQLDKERALQAVVLPGREEWQSVCPAEYLARIALEPDAFLSPVALPARDALARCLGRPSIGLDDDPATSEDWVAEWYGAFTQGRGAADRGQDGR